MERLKTLMSKSEVLSDYFNTSEGQNRKEIIFYSHFWRWFRDKNNKIVINSPLLSKYFKIKELWYLDSKRQALSGRILKN